MAFWLFLNLVTWNVALYFWLNREVTNGSKVLIIPPIIEPPTCSRFFFLKLMDFFESAILLNAFLCGKRVLFKFRRCFLERLLLDSAFLTRQLMQSILSLFKYWIKSALCSFFKLRRIFKRGMCFINFVLFMIFSQWTL